MSSDIDLYAIIKQQWRTYSEPVINEIKKSATKIGTGAVRTVKEKSPVKTGEYAKSWTRHTIKSDDGIYIRIHQKKKPTLTHLLESGHKSRNGSQVKAIKHIEQTEIDANNELSNEIDRIIEKHKND